MNKEKSKKSKSMARLDAEERCMHNKMRKLRKHVKSHPNDKQALIVVAAGGQGAPHEFPHISEAHHNVRPTMMEDLELEYRKHHTAMVNQNGRKKRVVVLEEMAASGPLYSCIGDGNIVLEISPDMAAVFRFYNERHGASIMVERQGDKVVVLKNKKAIPPKGFEGQFRRMLFEEKRS